MKVQPATVRCAKCEHDFASEIIVDCDVKVFVAALKSIRFPKCGKGGKNLELVKTEEVK